MSTIVGKCEFNGGPSSIKRNFVNPNRPIVIQKHPNRIFKNPQLLSSGQLRTVENLRRDAKESGKSPSLDSPSETFYLIGKVTASMLNYLQLLSITFKLLSIICPLFLNFRLPTVYLMINKWQSEIPHDHPLRMNRGLQETKRFSRNTWWYTEASLKIPTNNSG